MIKYEDLTDIDKKNLFNNKEIESEFWCYVDMDEIASDSYLFSSIGRCYDFLNKKFIKSYCNRNSNGCYWYLRDLFNSPYLFEKIQVSDVLKEVYSKKDRTMVENSINDGKIAFSSRVELNDKIIKNYTDKIEKLQSEIDTLNVLIKEERNKRCANLSILNAIKIANDEKDGYIEEQKTEYSGVKKYFDNLNIKLTHCDYIQIGRLASKYCKDYKLPIKQDFDGHNCYQNEVLKMVWYEYKKKFD